MGTCVQAHACTTLELLAATDPSTMYLFRDALMMQVEFFEAETKRDHERGDELIARVEEAKWSVEAWRLYAFNRKAQTKHLVRHIWNGVTGVEDPLDEVRNNMPVELLRDKIQAEKQ